MFEKGTLSRALRDILAERLKRHEDKIGEPFALATWMIQQGIYPLPPFTAKEQKKLEAVEKADVKFDPRELPGVIDLGMGHRHAIIDIPPLFDPWQRAPPFTATVRYLVVTKEEEPRLDTPALHEIAVTVPRRLFKQLAKLPGWHEIKKGMLVRRGRLDKATNIFILSR
jgi:hypothetical protein